MNRFTLLLLLVLSCITLQLSATHIIGGNFSYECLGGDDYKITLNVYRDCGPNAEAQLDDPAFVTVYNGFGFVVENIEITPVKTFVAPNLEGLCINSIPDVCVEHGLYEFEINLPYHETGIYSMVYQRCCRNWTIQNIVSPGDFGTTYTSIIPVSLENECENDSPVWNNFPPIIVCRDAPLVFDHSAFDPDGDELVYELCNPLAGALPLAAQPQIAPPPPYDLIEFSPGFSATDPMPSNPNLMIDPVTGLLEGFPTALGQFVVGICVSEYRDGELIATHLRDFQFNVASCDVVYVEVGADDIFVCGNDPIPLEGEVFGADDFQWSNPDDLDDPTSLTPTITNPVDGMTFTLSATSASGCGDDDVITINIVDEIEADAGDNAAICPGSTGVTLHASGGDIYSWSPVDGLSDPNVANPIASPTEETTYTVTITDALGICSDTDEVTVSFLDDENLDLGPNIEICAGETAMLSAPTGDSYSWEPIDGLDDATIQNPNATVSGNTTFTVTVSYSDGCIGTGSVDVIVSDPGNAGNVTADEYYCDGQSATVEVVNNIVPEGMITSFFLYESDITASQEVNNSGIFSLTDDMQTLTTYSVVAIVAPDSNEDGIADFDHPCAAVSAPTPITFLNAITINVEEECDWEFTGELTIIISATGGYADVSDEATYTFEGTQLIALTIPATEGISLNLGGFDGLVYSYAAIDELGCTGAMESQEVVCIKLPIELLSFTGIGFEEYNEISWVTGSETDNDYFILEWAEDIEMNFQPVAEIAGAGNTTVVQDYRYNHVTLNTTSYYRLSQVDYNGTRGNYSDVISVSKTSLNDGAPTMIETNSRNFSIVSPYQLRIANLYNLHGQLIRSYNAKHNSFIELMSGVYLLEVELENGTIQTFKIFK